jgi:hypothetical protein
MRTVWFGQWPCASETLPRAGIAQSDASTRRRDIRATGGRRQNAAPAEIGIMALVLVGLRCGHPVTGAMPAS